MIADHFAASGKWFQLVLEGPERLPISCYPSPYIVHSVESTITVLMATTEQFTEQQLWQMELQTCLFNFLAIERSRSFGLWRTKPPSWCATNRRCPL